MTAWPSLMPMIPRPILLAVAVPLPRASKAVARGGTADVVTRRDEVTVTASGRSLRAEMRLRAGPQ